MVSSVSEMLLSSWAALGGDLSPGCQIRAIKFCRAWGLSRINPTHKTFPNFPFVHLNSLHLPQLMETASAASKDADV